MNFATLREKGLRHCYADPGADGEQAQKAGGNERIPSEILFLHDDSSEMTRSYD
jgi:hypothetical protein